MAERVNFLLIDLNWLLPWKRCQKNYFQVSQFFKALNNKACPDIKAILAQQGRTPPLPGNPKLVDRNLVAEYLDKDGNPAEINGGIITDEGTDSCRKEIRPELGQGHFQVQLSCKSDNSQVCSLSGWVDELGLKLNELTGVEESGKRLWCKERELFWQFADDDLRKGAWPVCSKF